MNKPDHKPSYRMSDEPSDANAAASEVVTQPKPCWSRHFDNIGKPRPPVAWTLTYGCRNGHVVTASACDRCASSLVDGRQRCARCFLPMVVTNLAALDGAS